MKTTLTLTLIALCASPMAQAAGRRSAKPAATESRAFSPAQQTALIKSALGNQFGHHEYAVHLDTSNPNDTMPHFTVQVAGAPTVKEIHGNVVSSRVDGMELEDHVVFGRYVTPDGSSFIRQGPRWIRQADRPPPPPTMQGQRPGRARDADTQFWDAMNRATR
jgi:hypothetical protein